MALLSMSLKTKSAMMGDKGEPMGVPNFCLYIVLLKVKYVDSKIIFSAAINSSFGILLFSRMQSSLLTTLSIAKSNGMFVNNDTTSRESNTCLLSSLTPLSLSTSWKLFSTQFVDLCTPEDIIFCKKEANE